jgi:hypothetical protein
MFKKKQTTAVKGRSIAFLITLTVHLLLFFAAGAFVAMQVIERNETKFTGKQIVRPKMKLKKLHVPVKIEQQVKRQTPKLGQRVAAVQGVKTQAVDFKMPEMTGFGGGGGGVEISGAGFGGSLGFATTQLNVFGLKSTGEKILFILDTSNNMMVDPIGGIPAYTIIKDELMGLIDRLPPTALFNVVVYEMRDARAFSEELCPASDANIAQLKAWLAPLNSQNEKVGMATLPSPGTKLQFEQLPPIYNDVRGWPRGVCYAIQKQVDSLYFLGTQAYVDPIWEKELTERKTGVVAAIPVTAVASTAVDSKEQAEYEKAKAEWDKLVAEARQIYNEENARRKASGLPMQVIPGRGADSDLVQMILPKADMKYGPMSPETIAARAGLGSLYHYSNDEMLAYISAMSKKYGEQDRLSAKIGLKKKELSFNVIHFVPQDDKDNDSLSMLRLMAERMNGKYMQIRGMRAIKSASTSKN